MTANEARRKYFAKYREDNKERLREYRREWQRNNPDKVKQYAANYWNRLAEKAANDE